MSDRHPLTLRARTLHPFPFPPHQIDASFSAKPGDVLQLVLADSRPSEPGTRQEPPRFSVTACLSQSEEEAEGEEEGGRPRDEEEEDEGGERQ